MNATTNEHAGWLQPTPRQGECLEHFAKGEDYGWDFGAATLTSLAKAGLLERFRDPATKHLKWRLTPAGREHVEASKIYTREAPEAGASGFIAGIVGVGDLVWRATSAEALADGRAYLLAHYKFDPAVGAWRRR